MTIDKDKLQELLKLFTVPEKTESIEQIKNEIDKRVSELQAKTIEEAEQLSDKIIILIDKYIKLLWNEILEGIPYIVYPLFELLGTADTVRLKSQQDTLAKNPVQIIDIITATQLLYKKPELAQELNEIFLKNGYSFEQVNYILTNAIQPISPEEALYLYRIGKIDKLKLEELLRGNLKDTSDLDLYIEMIFNLLDYTQIRDLWLRGEISDDEMRKRLKNLGYKDSDIDKIVKLFFYIPSPSDLISMAVREAFNPEAIEKFDLLAEYPEELTDWGRKQGLSKEWAEKYWIAHWRLPSFTEGIEMFHRLVDEPIDDNADIIHSPYGETKYNVIGNKTLDLLLKTLDISPFWRDKLKEITYSPLTRVDVRRAFDLGIIDENDVYFTYRELGYNDKNATILTEFTILETISEERNKLRNELIEAYQLGYITERELRNYLEQLKFNNRTIDILISYAIYKKENDYLKTLIKAIEKEYKRGDITEEQAEQKLSNLGIEPADIVRYIDIWYSEKIESEKTLSKSDVEKLFKKRIFNKDEAIEELIRLGYSERTAQLLIKIWE